MPKNVRVWMVRAGNDNELAEVFAKEGSVAIGWTQLGDLSDLTTREEIKQRYRENEPEVSPGRVNVNGGQIYRFAFEISINDYVLSYIKASREVMIGRVISKYLYLPDPLLNHYPHIHKVEWLRTISRDAFSTKARNSMGSTLTVFNLDDYIKEIQVLLEGTQKVEVAEDEEEAPFFDDLKSKTDELIADMVSKLDPYDFQDLVAAVLEAMGFRAVSTPPGRDRGIDIIAFPDSLGLERPHIKGQVKHRQSTTGGPEMRSFVATLRPGDSGLYVSTGGFTRDAELEAERARESVRLLDRDAFIRLMLENYENLDPEFKAKIPLRRIWVPAE